MKHFKRYVSSAFLAKALENFVRKSSFMNERIQFYIKRIKEGRLQEMWLQTKWIYQYVRRYWKAMIFYTLLGMTGTVISLLSSLVSKDLVDIITRQETGRVLQTFAIMIGLRVGTTVMNQISS